MAELKRALPRDRSPESLRNHYEVEKSLADRLRAASREERKRLYRTMYDDLFARVPDHPRLLRRDDPALTERSNRSKLNLLRGFLGPTRVVAEFAPGDCRFGMEIARRAKFVYGIDISDQRGSWSESLENFRLIVYDGYELDLADASVDVAFSDQLVEHLHPDDTGLHFRLVRRILFPHGVYVFRTPHAFSGPHDVSRYFSDHAEGFHLKEWTYTEIAALLEQAGFSGWTAFWNAKGARLRLPFRLVVALERLLAHMPARLRRRVARPLLPNVTVAAAR
jgi:SAM-dependent methyltransferase